MMYLALGAAMAVLLAALGALGWLLRRGASEGAAALGVRLDRLDAQIMRMREAAAPAPDMSTLDDIAAGVKDDLSIMFGYVGKLATLVGEESDRVIARIDALDDARAPADMAEDAPASRKDRFQPEDDEVVEPQDDAADADPADEAPDDAEALADMAAHPVGAPADGVLEARLDAMEDAADARLATFRALMESRFETVREMLGDLEDEPASGAAAPDRDVAARLEAVMASAQSGVEALEELARAQAAGFAAVQACQARLEDGQTRLSDGLGGAPGGAASAALHERLAEIAAAFERSPTAAPATAPASSDRPIDALHDRLAALETRLDAAAIAADRQAEALGELSQALSLDRLAILADQAAERHEATERATRIARRIVDLAPMAATKQKAGS
jgi:hypothetical protein